MKTVKANRLVTWHGSILVLVEVEDDATDDGIFESLYDVKIDNPYPYIDMELEEILDYEEVA